MRNHFSYFIHSNVYKEKEKQALINLTCKKDRWMDGRMAATVKWVCEVEPYSAHDKIMTIKFNTWHLIYYWIIKRTVCVDSVCMCVCPDRRLWFKSTQMDVNRHERKNLTKVTARAWFLYFFLSFFCSLLLKNWILKVPIKSSKFLVNISNFIIIFTLKKAKR